MQSVSEAWWVAASAGVVCFIAFAVKPGRHSTHPGLAISARASFKPYIISTAHRGCNVHSNNDMAVV